jgi:hypothetical protein
MSGVKRIGLLSARWSNDFAFADTTEARDLCTCGLQQTAHQKGKSPKVDSGYSRVFNTTCALCYCDRFKKETSRIFKGIASDDPRVKEK